MRRRKEDRDIIHKKEERKARKIRHKEKQTDKRKGTYNWDIEKK